MRQSADQQMLRLNVQDNHERRRYEHLRKRRGVRVVDQYHTMLREICDLRFPEYRHNPAKMNMIWRQFSRAHISGHRLDHCGTWFFFPWSRELVHFLEENLHEELRTARNKYLITSEEQRTFRELSVAIVGLSVGSHAALSIVMQGGGKEMRLADHDILSGSNLNRIRLGFSFVGQNKTMAVAHQIYQMNPYARLSLYPVGISKKSIKKFLVTPRPVGLLIDEMDDILLKVEIRKMAKAYRIPVIMAADNGDGVVLDVERYDTNPKLSILHGVITPHVKKKMKTATPLDMGKIIGKIIGAASVTPRMRASVDEIGKTVYSWPQLGGAAELSGVVLAYAARMIATDGPLRSGRTVLSLEQIISRKHLSLDMA